MLAKERTLECEIFIVCIYLQGVLLINALSRQPVERNLRFTGLVMTTWSLLAFFGDPPIPLRHFIALGVLLHQTTNQALLFRRFPRRPRPAIILVASLQCLLYAAAIAWVVLQHELPPKAWYLTIAAIGLWWGLSRLSKRPHRSTYPTAPPLDHINGSHVPTP